MIFHPLLPFWQKLAPGQGLNRENSTKVLGPRDGKETFSSLLIFQTGAAQPSPLAGEYKGGAIFLLEHPDPSQKLPSQSQCIILIMDHTGHLSGMMNLLQEQGRKEPSINIRCRSWVESPGCPSFSSVQQDVCSQRSTAA